MPPIRPFFACVMRAATLTGGGAGAACPGVAAGEGWPPPPRPPAACANFGAIAPTSFASASNDAFTSAGTSFWLAISFDSSPSRALSGVMAPANCVTTRWSSCISIAMSYIFLRSIAVRPTSGSAATFIGFVSTVLPSTTSATL